MLPFSNNLRFKQIIEEIQSVAILLFALLIIFVSCRRSSHHEQIIDNNRVRVEIITDQGTIIIALYDETPLHKKNFIKLVNEGVYDSLIFHRVIRNFVIQAGDPFRKNEELIDSVLLTKLAYTVPAEFSPNIFNKRGAVGSARSFSKDRASNSTQFTIIQGKVYNDSLLKQAEGRINEFLAQHYFMNDARNQVLLDSFQRAQELMDWDTWDSIYLRIVNDSKNYDKFETYSIPQQHRDTYKSIGGAAHLDQNYTVFGEVIQGIEVVDSIASKPVNDKGRPYSDIHIISMRIIK